MPKSGWKTTIEWRQSGLPTEAPMLYWPSRRDMSDEQSARYARHLTLPEVGPEGQKLLNGASVLVVGAGGLGSPALLYLAAAGVGRIGIVDFDLVDYSNLQRQVIHGTPDVGRTKLESACDSLNALNPEVRLEKHNFALSSSNALDLIRDYDVVVDGSDNFPTRYLVNDACVLLGKPNCYGSIFRFEGQASVFSTTDGPCYRCLYPEPPPPGLVPSCAEGGVLGVLPGVIGTIQATEAVKLIVGVGEPLILGDVNEDSFIDILDVILLLNFILEIDTPNSDQIWLSDVNFDTMINILDIVALVNIILN